LHANYEKSLCENSSDKTTYWIEIVNLLRKYQASSSTKNLIERILSKQQLKILPKKRHSDKAKKCIYHQSMEQAATGDVNTKSGSDDLDQY